MYEAMASAPLGDDVLGDDPTVIRLQEIGAKFMGHEAGLFTPSGTMANQIALATQAERGSCIALDEEAHILYYEVGAPAVLAGVVTRTVPSNMGVMDPSELKRAMLSASLHTPGTTMICVENTHNRSGGQVIPMDVMREYRAIADHHGAKLHLDGARVFNATTWLGIEPKDLGQIFDSISFCLSKGLGAPVGSLLVGSQSMIQQAQIWRKRLGGGMRQSGLLAACGIVSLETHIPLLVDDHRRARELAILISKIGGLSVDIEHQCTNFCMVDTELPASVWIDALAKQGVDAMPPSPNRIRLVTHSDITDEDVTATIAAFETVSDSLSGREIRA